MHFTTDDLVRIAAAGGGFKLDASRTVEDLVRIAAAAASGGATITISGIHHTVDDLVRIAYAGKGKIIFEE